MGRLSKRSEEVPASPVRQEKGKIDMSFLDLTHANLKCTAMTHLIVFPIPFAFLPWCQFTLQDYGGCHIHNQGPRICGDIPVSS